MTRRKHVTIYGAGMSGLVAAINLAREGYEVTVHDREKAYGGDPRYNPSRHTMPILPKKMSEYIGIDITSAFKPMAVCPTYFHEIKVEKGINLVGVKRVNKLLSSLIREDKHTPFAVPGYAGLGACFE